MSQKESHRRGGDEPPFVLSKTGHSAYGAVRLLLSETSTGPRAIRLFVFAEDGFRRSTVPVGASPQPGGFREKSPGSLAAPDQRRPGAPAHQWRSLYAPRQ